MRYKDIYRAEETEQSYEALCKFDKESQTDVSTDQETTKIPVGWIMGFGCFGQVSFSKNSTKFAKNL